MGSRKAELIKKRLAKKFRSNKPAPEWKRRILGRKFRPNERRRHWRNTKTNVY
ncbi:RL39 [Hepatospora eriocheir]|nr:RL39 [Hepatospora eriocheir]